jgi:hypothetical protein
MRLLRSNQLCEPDGPPADSKAVLYVKSCEVADRPLIGNVRTRMLLLDTGPHQFPVSVNDGGEPPDNCYVVSPVTAYGKYAEEEVARLKKRALQRPLSLLASGVAAALEAMRMDRIVQVNNWLLSTNLYPSTWEGEDLPGITDLLRSTFPDHAFGFRSLNARCHKTLLERMRRLGYTAIPSRQVYVFEGREGERSAFLSRHNTRLDASLLKRGGYRVLRGEALKEKDFVRLEHLYNQLYLEKYSRLNPHYTADWLRAGQRDGWLQLSALECPRGCIDGVVGWFASDTNLSAPIVGYDTGLPRQTGLYRQLTSLCLQEAADRRMVLNFSSGASHFKRLRGGEPEIEFSMCYVRHLPATNRLAWSLLGSLLKGIGVPLLKALKL